MMNTTGTDLNRAFLKAACLVALVFLGLVMANQPVSADGAGEVQIVTGRLASEDGDWYTLRDLKAGQTLQVYMTRTSGNLDPFVAVVDRVYQAGELESLYSTQLEQAIADGHEPVEAIRDIADRLALAWNDDSAQGYTAVLEYVIPVSGDYQLLASGTLTRNTFGEYRLLLGLDAPEVLKGNARSTGDVIATLDRRVAAMDISVREITGTLSVDAPDARFTLLPVRRGDTFDAYVEAVSGDLIPRMVLYDFGEKPLRSANLIGSSPTATLSYRFDGDSQNDVLHVFNHPYEQPGATTSGEFRLLLGINEPKVLTGEAEPSAQPVLREPIEVQIGITLDQITDVDQKAEKFGVVASVTMKWTDPKLAFSPDTCQCSFKSFTDDAFSEFADQNEISWPECTILNQQGNRWTQNKNGFLTPDGEMLYFERFTTDLQAPDFNFEKFPFDVQKLAIRVTSLLPKEFFVFTDPPAMSHIGTQLGEEEWRVTDSHTEISLYNEARSTYSLIMEVQRHVSFYVFRIFLPILLIIIVSWFTFFLKDYGKRIDVTSANLLLFIAFNFTISSELPRLGYLTFMDSILIMTFVVSALVIVFNVYLKRAETRRKGELAKFLLVLDDLMIVLYPLLYVLGVAALIRYFFIK